MAIQHPFVCNKAVTDECERARHESLDGLASGSSFALAESRRNEHHSADDHSQVEREQDQRGYQRAGPGRRRFHALPPGARRRPRQGRGGARGAADQTNRRRRRVRRRRLFHLDVLRSLRTAHDRLPRRPLPGCGARKLHQLDDRPQPRRRRAHRRPGQTAHLRRLGPDRHRCRQDRRHHRHDLLARQCVPARRRGDLRAGDGKRHRSPAVVGQPRDRGRGIVSHCLLSDLASAASAVDRLRRVANCAAQHALYARPDRHWRVGPDAW